VSGDAWVYGNAWVSGNARVYGDACVYGNARVSSQKHIAWFTSVGSECGTLTAYITKTSEIEVTRGCFRGALDQFAKTVKNRHGDNRYGEEYLALIEFIRLRFRELTVELEEAQE